MEIKVFDKSIKKFIQSLSKTTGPKLAHTIELLKEFNYKLGPPHSKQVSKNLFELRTYGNQKVRILYTFHKEQIVLLHGFIKKFERIPPKELKTAKQKLSLLTNK